MFVQEKVQSFTVSDSAPDGDAEGSDHRYLPHPGLYAVLRRSERSGGGAVQQGHHHPDDYPAAPGTNWLQVLLPYVLAIMAFILLMNLMTRMNGSGAGGVSDKMAHFGEARVSSIPEGDKKVTFKRRGRRGRGKGGTAGDRGISARPGEVS